MSVYYLCLCFFLFFGSEMRAEKLTATSTHQMRRVLEGEDDLLRDFRIYIEVVEHKLSNIRIIVEDALRRQEEAMLDPVGYVSNPLNALPMLRRMQQDAPKLYSYLKEEEGKDLQQVADYNLDVITQLDLEYAAKGLLRIQETYNLDERDMAKGLLAQKQYNAKLSTLDCVCLAKYLHKQGDDQDAAKWLEIALEQYGETPEPVLKLMKTERAGILRQLGMIHSQQGNFQGFWEACKQILKNAESEEQNQEEKAFTTMAEQHLAHLSNCRGLRELPVSSGTRCSYNTRNSPFLRLAPLKEERLSLDPHVVLYHDVVYHDEIAEILDLARPYLSRALVGTLAPRSDVQRTAVRAALTQNASVSVERLNRRIKDMSGLELSLDRELEVINYGLGGQYYMHYDCSLDQPSLGHHGYNNRIATVLLYLTDVELGGVTSFPVLRLGVPPKRGAALVWHNVDNAGECDKRTLHAACPVLQGNRWVAAQWFEMAKQKQTLCSAD